MNKPSPTTEALVARLEAHAKFYEEREPTRKAVMLAMREAAAALRQKEEQYEACKLQAQSHAMEARTANATIAEIYQLCTKATGEPGNWHGAEPVRQALAAAERELAELRAQQPPAKRVLEAAVDAYNAGRYMTDVNLANAVRAYLGGAMPAWCDEEPAPT